MSASTGNESNGSRKLLLTAAGTVMAVALSVAWLMRSASPQPVTGIETVSPSSNSQAESNLQPGGDPNAGGAGQAGGNRPRVGSSVSGGPGIRRPAGGTNSPG